MSELNKIVEDVPQILINCRVKKRIDLDEIPGYSAMIKRIEDELDDKGRVFIRFSGTEPVVRVLVEGVDKMKINAYANEIAQFLDGALA